MHLKLFHDIIRLQRYSVTLLFLIKRLFNIQPPEFYLASRKPRTPEASFPINNAYGEKKREKERDIKAAITNYDRYLDPPPYLPSQAEEEEKENRGRNAPQTPPTSGGGGGLDMFRCICCHALYRVRSLEVIRRPIEWRRTYNTGVGIGGHFSA